MQKKIEAARKKVRLMEEEKGRLENKYRETKDELYKEMAEFNSEEMNRIIVAIMDAERKLSETK